MTVALSFWPLSQTEPVLSLEDGTFLNHIFDTTTKQNLILDLFIHFIFAIECFITSRKNFYTRTEGIILNAISWSQL